MSLPACKQENCEVAKDGKCLEGLDTSVCPHFYLLDVEQFPNTELSSPIRNAETEADGDLRGAIKILAGNELEVSDLGTVTHLHYNELIVILGDYNSGKTTMLSTLFDVLQIGEFQGYSFAGSLTLPGFEKICHLARMSSGRISADTERTKSLQLHFLHLDLVQKASGIKKHFLFSDVSGETIRQARNSSRAMNESLQLVKNADHIFFILDGDLISSNFIHNTLNDFNLFIESALSNGIFNEDNTLNVVISKWDIVLNRSEFSLDALVITPILNRFKSRFKKISFLQVASRPEVPSAEVPIGFGLGLFLNELFHPKTESIKSELPKSKRELRRFESFEIWR